MRSGSSCQREPQFKFAPSPFPLRQLGKAGKAGVSVAPSPGSFVDYTLPSRGLSLRIYDASGIPDGASGCAQRSDRGRPSEQQETRPEWAAPSPHPTRPRFQFFPPRGAHNVDDGALFRSTPDLPQRLSFNAPTCGDIHL